MTAHRNASLTEEQQTELDKKRQSQNERKAKSRAKLEKFDMKEVRFEASKSQRDQLNDLCKATTGEPFSKQELILKLIREAHKKQFSDI